MKKPKKAKVATFTYYILFTHITGARAPNSGPARGASNGSSAAAMAQIEDLNAQLLEKNLAIEGLEKERDFYFGKLRDIEVLTQEGESIEGASEFCQKVLGVLYATEVGTLCRQLKTIRNTSQTLFILISLFPRTDLRFQMTMEVIYFLLNTLKNTNLIIVIFYHYLYHEFFYHCITLIAFKYYLHFDHRSSLPDGK